MYFLIQPFKFSQVIPVVPLVFPYCNFLDILELWYLGFQLAFLI